MVIEQIEKQAFEEIKKVENSEELENFKITYLGRKGELTAILRSLKNLPMNKRKKIGVKANKLRKKIEKAINEKSKKIQNSKFKIQNSGIDITATDPNIKIPEGHLHPITQVLRQIEDAFDSMGFEIVQGPDVETEYYNFDALNIPKEHPARDAWDTFWLKQSTKSKPSARPGLQGKSNLGLKLLRTHTSPMQIRYMEKNNPPFRMIVPGRTFRYEATDASHFHTFYQVEGLMVDRNINVANLKSVIEGFLKKLFSRDIKVRLRPSYFPFTEPSFEIDLKGGKFKNWLEVMGAGMVHPNVFKAVDYDPVDWQGFAFGLGLDRIAMIKYGINDIRLLYNGDLRFLKQF